jgi:hypothetical protein
MKKPVFYLILILSLSFLTGCTPSVHHDDPFYNYNDSDFPRDHLPLIKPVEATRERPSSPWRLRLLNVIYITLPKSQEQDLLHTYYYGYVEELEKFAVKDGVIVAYSAYVNDQADPFILNDFYHWFVMVPGENITKGFHTEDAFRQSIQTLGVDIEESDWQTPDEAFDTFLETGCLEWIPDCN